MRACARAPALLTWPRRGRTQSFLKELDKESKFALWLDRYIKVIRKSKLTMEDRTVEQKLVDAVFNANWGKQVELENATLQISPWDVMDCVPSFADRVFNGCTQDQKKMTPQAAAQALATLSNVCRYAIVDTVAFLVGWASTPQFESGGNPEKVAAGLGADVILKLLNQVIDKIEPGADAPARQLVLLDRNLALVLHNAPDGGKELRAKLPASVELAPVDIQSDRKVMYEVLVAVHRGGPHAAPSEAMLMMRKHVNPLQCAEAMIAEVMNLASQGPPAPSFATMFNLVSIGTFLLAQNASDAAPDSEGSMSHATETAVRYMEEVLPAMVAKLDSPRLALLLARFTTMLTITLAASVWRSIRAPQLFPPNSPPALEQVCPPRPVPRVDRKVPVRRGAARRVRAASRPPPPPPPPYCCPYPCPYCTLPLFPRHRPSTSHARRGGARRRARRRRSGRRTAPSLPCSRASRSPGPPHRSTAPRATQTARLQAARERCSTGQRARRSSRGARSRCKCLRSPCSPTRSASAGSRRTATSGEPSTLKPPPARADS